MKTHLLPLRATLLGSLLLLATPALPAADAQIKFPDPSPKAAIEQRVGTTDIKVEYFRPSMKGRKIFGGLEAYGAVWRTGANSPTKITFSTAVKFGGKDVPAGSYGLFTIPGEQEWTVIINKIGERDWGAYAYKAENDVARVSVKPSVQTANLETFTIGFGSLKTDSAQMSLAWEKTRVAVKIEVDLSALKAQVAEVMASNAEKKPYLNAAMFYYDTGGDMKQALAWMDEGLKAQPEAFWMSYRRGLILEKMGDKAGAKAAAEASKATAAAAAKQPQSLRDEYARLNDALIARVK
jgi:hypothetical protein